MRSKAWNKRFIVDKKLFQLIEKTISVVSDKNLVRMAFPEHSNLMSTSIRDSPSGV